MRPARSPRASQPSFPSCRRIWLSEGSKLAPTRRNLYYCGVNAYQMGEYADAVSFFKRALKAQVHGPSAYGKRNKNCEEDRT